jgi:hypothetical protein
MHQVDKPSKEGKESTKPSKEEKDGLIRGDASKKIGSVEYVRLRVSTLEHATH